MSREPARQLTCTLLFRRPCQLRQCQHAPFSSTTRAAANSPKRRRVQNRAVGPEPTKRGQSTAVGVAPQRRPIPSPAFNQEPTRDEVHPLLNPQQPELDDSLVGLSGGEIVHKMLKELGVQHVFGYPGGAILPTFDAIYNSKNFDFILPRHEQGAGHMAEGYARATGKPGVVLVTSGPGATNVVTPMQDALSDGTPMVVLCGQVVTGAIGSDAFQEADVVGISRACTKWNVMVKRVEELPKRLKEAFEIATHGRPGPVLVDLPKDVQAAILRQPIPTSSTIPSHPSAASLLARSLSQKHLEDSIQRVAKLVNKAKKPVIYAGQGMLAHPDGPRLLTEFAEKCKIPATTTLQGLGCFDELNDLSLHMLGMHGSPYANLAMQEADLILALGARFDDRVTGSLAKFAPQAKAAAEEGRGGIVHFEILPKNINKVVQATEAVEGDVATNLALLIPKVNAVPDRSEWLGQVADWKARLPFDYDRGTPDELIKPQTVIEKLSDMTAHMKDRTIITTGVGQHQMWCAQHFRWRSPRTMVTSGGLGTMGYGLPAAIGAKVGRPDCLVVDIDGDASFNMTLTELSTAAQFHIPIKIIVLNNEEQGMVTQWQSLFYEDRFAHTHQKNPDFVLLAQAMGIEGRRCLSPGDVEDSLKWLIDESEGQDGPKLLEVVTDKKIPVLPMVPAGAGLHEYLVYDAGTLFSLFVPFPFFISHARAVSDGSTSSSLEEMLIMGRMGKHS